ncbi:hypothetical protein DAMNIGENAA_24370 [Desulforhabdus amnigena]|jgi:hypothetical protein|uniref:Nucleotidyl transferase AbiEii/AbiGii toxin family protein n=1 Tax=Desulforhabdus amnigena TaxID=40218 RepID=A0A9W6FUA6_9BACT|nr:hypothetical protein [Desulforhabdus amnigena]GLI35004.1 hypothetical protein DAMNIGENAA_24370 [Desulforhabdus amnigena]
MTSLEMVITVARRLGSLRDEVAFLGGATTSFLITDPAYPQVRPTLDVDVIVKIASRMEYYRLEERLRNLGFTQAMGKDEPVCRWLVEGVKIDVMPTEESILGFSNRWYSDPLIRTLPEMDRSCGWRRCRSSLQESQKKRLRNPL